MPRTRIPPAVIILTSLAFACSSDSTSPPDDTIDDAQVAADVGADTGVEDSADAAADDAAMAIDSGQQDAATPQDSGVSNDAGQADAGQADTGMPSDSGAADPDAAVADATIVAPDAMIRDATVVAPDATVMDASSPDAAVPDATFADATVVRPDASPPDAEIPDTGGNLDAESKDSDFVEDASFMDAGFPDTGAPDTGPAPVCDLVVDPPETNAGQVGANGGSVGPFLECPAGEEIIGIAVRMSDQNTSNGGPSAVGVTIICAAVTVGSTGPTVGTETQVEVSGTGQFGWSPATQSTLTRCPAGSLVTGLSASRGASNNRFIEVTLTCRPILSNGTVGAGPQDIYVVGSLMEAGQVDTAECPVDQVVRRIGTRIGAGFDAATLNCAVPSCTP